MIDINKKYQYRNGEPARILCTDRKHDSYPVISMSDLGEIRIHDKDGLFNLSNFNHHYDLIEVKEKKVLWLNVYEEPFEGIVYRDIEEAKSPHTRLNIVARIKVEYSEGQFDE